MQNAYDNFVLLIIIIIHARAFSVPCQTSPYFTVSSPAFGGLNFMNPAGILMVI